MTELSDRFREDWDLRAKENYMHYVGLFSQSARFEELARLEATFVTKGYGTILTPKMKAIEIGCGVGRLLKYVTPLFSVAYGVDVSAEMLKRARLRLAGLKNIVLVTCNGLNLEGIADESMDFAYSWGVFQHLPKKIARNYVAEAFRILRPGGILRFQVYRSTIPIKLYRIGWAIYAIVVDRLLRKLEGEEICLRNEPPETDTMSLRFYTLHEIEEMVKEAGFILMGVDEFKFRFPKYYYTRVMVTCRKDVARFDRE